MHSDQGFQYQHVSWRRLLQSADATQSMSRKADYYDNAVMKNFFGHLKEELFQRVRSLSTDALTTALHEYIRWYNTERISIKLKGLSPVQHRAQTLIASPLTKPVQLSGTSPVGQGLSFQNSYDRARPRVPSIAGATIPTVAISMTDPARAPYTGQSIATEKTPSMP
ncbi:hypothetical protein E2F48_11635 [Arthrobacter crusticola]|uniref:Integrase catalytic domain-containing protein n=1 Tax=Arthrobacter crusticola TaxID=2547960 RepID=A0A4R5TXF5_9MICC|nr:hypothetical protein E2F48_11635 [Arthrobacter crusticola]